MIVLRAIYMFSCLCDHEVLEYRERRLNVTNAGISWQPASDDAQRQARRGLSVFFAIVVPLTAVFQVIIISTGNLSWIN